MKQTLQDKLQKRKFKKPNRLAYDFLYHFVFNTFLAWRVNAKYKIIDDINKEKGPCFLIANHQSRMDYIYTVKSSYPRRLNFVAQYNEFFRSHLHWIFKVANIVPKKNFNPDVKTIKSISALVKQGAAICIFPEGTTSICGHNQPSYIGTGNLFKHHKIPVYMCKLEGAFLTNHKVCLDLRKGQVNVTMSKLFNGDEFDNLTCEQVEEIIDRNLYQDDYEWNKKERIKYDTKGRSCHNLHQLCYRCPRCGTEFMMLGKGNEIKCLKCGNGAIMNDYYDLIPYDKECVIPESPSKWVDEERRRVYLEIKNNPDFEIIEKVKIGTLPKQEYLKDYKTSEPCGEGEIKINHQGFFFKGIRFQDDFTFHLNYEQLATLDIVLDTSYFALYVNGEYYDFFPEREIVGKLLLIVEEMHRLHSNKWKNFPWMDWIYKEKTNK